MVTAPLLNVRQLWVSLVLGDDHYEKIWHAKEPSLLTGNEWRATVKICSLSPAMATSPYEWKLFREVLIRSLIHFGCSFLISYLDCSVWCWIYNITIRCFLFLLHVHMVHGPHNLPAKRETLAKSYDLTMKLV